MKPLHRRALSGAAIALGLGVLIYALAIIAMADSPLLGALSAGACCLPLALIFFIAAYVIYKGGDA